MSKWIDRSGDQVNPYEPRGSHTKRPRYFIVRGTGDFPVDMLRYDKAWALTGVGDPNDFNHPVRDVVCATGDGHILVPSEGRWESFGWEVVERSLSRQDARQLIGLLGSIYSNIFTEMS
jgi:hypothetical protein